VDAACGGYDQTVFRWLLLGSALLLTACSNSVSLNVHNGTDGPIVIDGLDAPVTVQPAETARIDGLSSIPTPLSATLDGREVETQSIATPPPGGEAVWVVGGGACFAEADYGSYYGDIGIPAGAVVVGSSTASEHVYVSEGRVRAGPGQMLPKTARGAVHALVQVPCQANQEGEALLRSWLEIKLLEIQPK
jgi:hypothetical protein